MGDIATQTAMYFSNEREFAIGGHCKMSLINAKGSASYATGGDRVTPSILGMGAKARIAFLHGGLSDSGTYIIRPIRVDINTMKLIFIVTATGSEVANATNLSAETFTLVGICVQ